MASFNKYLSKEQTDIFKIIERVGCISTNQVNRIMKAFMNASEKKANIVIQDLVNRQYIQYALNEKVLLAGENRFGSSERVNRNIIESLNIALDMIDDFDNLKFISLPTDGTEICFLANNQMYKTMHLTLQNMFKIMAVQQAYDTEVKNGSYKNSEFSYTVIFIISAEDNEKAILSKLENDINLHIPHIIAVMEDSDFTQYQNYTKYGVIDDEV